MSDQAAVPTIQVPGAPPSQPVVAPPATQQPAPGTPAPQPAPRRSGGQRRTKGLPGVPLAVGAVNTATTLGAEVAMSANSVEAGAAAAVAALAAGVYALRSNARYRRSPRSGPGAWLNSLSPVQPRSSRTSGPDQHGPRTSSAYRSGTGPGRTKSPDQRTNRGPAGADQRTSHGPGGKGAGPGGRTSGPGADQLSTRADRTSRTNGRGRHAADQPVRTKRNLERARVAGRTAAKGWRTTAPARRFAGRQLNRAARRVLWPTLVAALTGLRRRSWREAIEAWKRIRADKDAPENATAPQVSDTVRKPKNSTDKGLGRVTDTGGAPSMAAAAFVQSTAEMMGAASVYDPQGMMQVGNDLAQTPVALRNVAETMRIMTQRSNDNDPINPAIIDKMQEVYKLLLTAAQASEDLAPMFRNLHHVDIQRLEQPRKNEQKWDVTANR